MKKQVKLALIVPEKIRTNCEVWFKGETREEVLKKLHDWVFFEQDLTKIDGCTFQISGDDRLFAFNGTMFHYCFDKGCISVEEMLENVCYEEA